MLKTSSVDVLFIPFTFPFVHFSWFSPVSSLICFWVDETDAHRLWTKWDWFDILGIQWEAVFFSSFCADQDFEINKVLYLLLCCLVCAPLVPSPSSPTGYTVNSPIMSPNKIFMFLITPPPPLADKIQILIAKHILECFKIRKGEDGKR